MDRDHDVIEDGEEEGEKEEEEDAGSSDEQTDTVQTQKQTGTTRKCNVLCGPRVLCMVYSIPIINYFQDYKLYFYANSVIPCRVTSLLLCHT